MGEYKAIEHSVNAFQMTEARQEDESTWPNWLVEAAHMDCGEVNSVMRNFPSRDILIMRSFSTGVVIPIDYWVIRDMDGTLNPCSPRLFDRMYEPVS